VAFVKYHEVFDLKFKLNGNAAGSAPLDASFADGSAFSSGPAAGIKMIVNQALVSLTDASKDDYKVYKLIFTASG